MELNQGSSKGVFKEDIHIQATNRSLNKDRGHYTTTSLQSGNTCYGSGLRGWCSSRNENSTQISGPTMPHSTMITWPELH